MVVVPEGGGGAALLLDDDSVVRTVDGWSVVGVADVGGGECTEGAWVGATEGRAVDGLEVDMLACTEGAWVGAPDGHPVVGPEVEGGWVGATEGRAVDGLEVELLLLGWLVGWLAGGDVRGTERSTHSTRAVGAGLDLKRGPVARGSHHVVPVSQSSSSHCNSAVLHDAPSGGLTAEDAVYASSPPETCSAAP